MNKTDLPEYSVTGAILIDASCIPAVRGVLSSGDFAMPPCRAVFDAACALADSGKTLDAVTIGAEAAAHCPDATDEYLRQLMEITPTAANVLSYAEAVRKQAVRRQLLSIVSDVATDEATDPDELLCSALGKLNDLSNGASSRAGESPAESITGFYKRLGQQSAHGIAPFTSTGFKTLDDVLGGGLVESGLIVIGARPGVGKSMLGLAIADNLADKDGVVLYISLEMSEDQLNARRVARISGLSYNALQRHDMHDDEGEWQRAGDACGALSKRQVHIRDSSATVTQIELWARAIKGLTCIVIDHIGLIQPAPDTARNGLYEQTTRTSHALKRLAISLGIPIVALCQLNRQSEGRPDKRPTLADLRNSGAIEEDADAVLLLNRPALYADDPPAAWGVQDLFVDIAKNRHAATGTVKLNFCGLNARIWEGS